MKQNTTASQRQRPKQKHIYFYRNPSDEIKASLALAFILCFILSSCNLNKTEHMFLNTGETLSFPARQSARFVQGVNIDGHDFFVFADYRTNKELTIYDLPDERSELNERQKEIC